MVERLVRVRRTKETKDVRLIGYAPVDVSNLEKQEFDIPVEYLGEFLAWDWKLSDTLGLTEHDVPNHG